MTPAKAKSATLSETAKGMLVTWMKEQLYNRRKEIQSKYMTKGNTVEDEAIMYLNKLHSTDHRKNEQYFEDTYLHGTPDVITDDTIIDFKSSWDCFTFPLFSSSLPNRDYMYQLQGYMMLTGKRKGAIVYTLMDLPDEQIEQEWRHSGGIGKASDEFVANYKYNDIADKLRVKRFDFEYCPDMAEQIVSKVEEARRFVSNLKY
jgi:hypothetical protein